MKKLVFAFAIILLYLAGKAQTPYYYCNYEGKKKYLSLNTGYAFLSLNKQQLPADIQKRKSVKSFDFYSDKICRYQYQGKKGTSRYYTVLHFEEKMSEKQYFELLADIKRNNKDVIISPYFKSESDDKVGLSNFF